MIMGSNREKIKVFYSIQIVAKRLQGEVFTNEKPIISRQTEEIMSAVGTVMQAIIYIFLPIKIRQS
jgi:hypothetical protein